MKIVFNGGVECPCDVLHVICLICFSIGLQFFILSFHKISFQYIKCVGTKTPNWQSWDMSFNNFLFVDSN